MVLEQLLTLAFALAFSVFFTSVARFSCVRPLNFSVPPFAASGLVYLGASELGVLRGSEKNE